MHDRTLTAGAPDRLPETKRLGQCAQIGPRRTWQRRLQQHAKADASQVIDEGDHRLIVGSPPEVRGYPRRKAPRVVVNDAAQLRILASLENDADEEPHPAAVEHQVAEQRQNVALLLTGSAVRHPRRSGPVVSVLEQRHDELHPAREVVGQVRLTHASPAGDFRLGQRLDAVHLDDVEGGIENASPDVAPRWYRSYLV